MDIQFQYPKKCKFCGFNNFKISGVVHNGSLDYMRIEVRCMRCGKPVDIIDSRDTASQLTEIVLVSD